MRSIRENIWTAVLKYGPDEVRSVRKTKVQIFPVWTELIGQQKLYCIANILFVYENLSFVSRSIRVLGGLALDGPRINQ